MHTNILFRFSASKGYYSRFYVIYSLEILTNVALKNSKTLILSLIIGITILIYPNKSGFKNSKTLILSSIISITISKKLSFLYFLIICAKNVC